MKFQFPHFPQLKPARLFFGLETVVLWMSLTALITVNVLALRTSRPTYWNEVKQLFSSPFSVSRHIDLASRLWQHGQKPEARELMISAQSFSRKYQTRAQGNTVNVLGNATSPLDTLSQWEHETDQLKNKYAFWQSVVLTKPDYRDAFIVLAALAYQLRNMNDANNWLTKAQALDPNYPTAQQLSRYIQEVQ